MTIFLAFIIFSIHDALGGFVEVLLVIAGLFYTVETLVLQSFTIIARWL